MEFVSVEILLNGNKLADTYQLLSVETEREVGAVARASFSLLLPRDESVKEAFAASEAETFLPGVSVEIKVGYKSNNKNIFEGVIIGHRLRSQPGESPQLQLRCESKAAKLTVGRRTLAFVDKKDSEIMSSVLANAGLNKDVDATAFIHPSMVQNRITDWSFLVSRAAANGMIVYTENGKVMVKKPDVKGSAVLTLNYKQDVFSFDGEVNAGWQFDGAKTTGWDFSAGEPTEGEATEPTVNKQGNISGKKLAAVLEAGPMTHRTTTPLSDAQLKSHADSMLLQVRLAAQRGRVTFFGNASPKLNSLIELKGFGGRFNGDALITKVRHTVREGTWRTEVGYGLPPDWQASLTGSTNAASIVPAITGLQNGTVVKITEDPDNQQRIQVDVPMLGERVWARQASIYATSEQGAFFLPEVGDEVVLGFLDEDPRFGVILGSLAGPQHKPAYVADEKNTIKAFSTKGALKIEMNDEDKVFTISTPGENTVVLSDKDKSIILTDQHKNTVTMNDQGITLKSGKDIVIDAVGKISLKAGQAIDVSSSGGDVSLKGLNVKGEGQVGMSMKGGATAEFSASGNTTLKGAMVMIN